MSFKSMVEAFEAKIGNPARKLVLLKLADQANDNGLCWPSYATIASACEVDRRTVIRHIKQLEKDGFLRVEKTYNKDAGKNYSNRYHLTIANGVKKPLVSEDHHPSDKLSPPLVTKDHPPSVKLSPEPINEPIKEPINKDITQKKKANDKKVKFQPVKPEQVSNQVWNDLLAVRKTKRAVDSQTAWTRLGNSVDKAQKATGHSLEDIYSYWVKRSWAGFDHQWYIDAHPQPTNNIQGNTNANSHSANHSNQQFDTSTTAGYAAKLDADAERYYAEQARAQQSINGSTESAF